MSGDKRPTGAKETIELPDGSKLRDSPRLIYGAAHLTDPENQRTADISLRAAYGFFIGLGCWLVLTFAITLVQVFQHHSEWECLSTQIYSVYEPAEIQRDLD